MRSIALPACAPDQRYQRAGQSVRLPLLRGINDDEVDRAARCLEP
jgi:hypothetical protein